jgi:hypothetical protein
MIIAWKGVGQYRMSPLSLFFRHPIARFQYNINRRASVEVAIHRRLDMANGDILIALRRAREYLFLSGE